MENKETVKPITMDDVYNSLIEQAKKEGKTFDSPEAAKEWAVKGFEKAKSQTIKKGTTIKCSVCNKGFSNRETGPLTCDGPLYTHRNCKNVI